MALIILIILLIYFVLLTWNWKNLGGIEKSKKIMFISIGLLVMYIISLIVFNISKSGSGFDGIINKGVIKNIFVTIFTGINGIVVLPQIARVLDKINEGKYNKKRLKKTLIIVLVVFLIVLLLERLYLKDSIIGIVKAYGNLKK